MRGRKLGLGISLVFMLLFGMQCRWAAETKLIDASAAWKIVREKVLENQLSGKRCFISVNMLKAGEIIRTWRQQHQVPEKFAFAWVVFIDDAPEANWEHACRYVFIDAASSEYVIRQASTPPDNLNSEFKEMGAKVPTSGHSPKNTKEKGAFS